jgi:tRNA threonylcarbamoyladenosine biosynthesis protein TsaE
MSPGARRVLTRSVAETEALAAELGATLVGGEVLLLLGELGAGKTAFVRGLAQGIGVDPAEVVSPTFVLLTSHPGRLTLFHADLYRLKGDGDDTELGLEELPGPDGVLAIEWAERLSAQPWPRLLQVRLEHAGEDGRQVTIVRAAETPR